jgi:TatD DNase family protein
VKLIDTHCHLYARQLQPDLAAVLERARQVCSAVFLPNIDLESLPAMNELADAHPGFLYPMLGLHPCDVSEDYSAQLAVLEAEFQTGRRYWGVGETGIDLYWDKTTLARQQQSLHWHCVKARELGLPLVLHCREAFTETAEVVQAEQTGSLRGIFHCWVDGVPQARQALDLGFYLGVGGVATYKNTVDLAEALRFVPRDRVVLETDSPYLAPVPHRGKRNEPAFVQYVAERLAALWETTVEEVASITTRNAQTLFGLA